MGNMLFQQANKAVELAENSLSNEQIKIARNNLSSAFANSTNAEKEQLHELQNRLEQCERNITKQNI